MQVGTRSASNDRGDYPLEVTLPRPRASACRRAAVTAALTIAVSSVAVGSPGAVAAPRNAAAVVSRAGTAGSTDLSTLRRELAAATEEVARLSDEVFAAAARTAHLRRAMDQLAEDHDTARAALDDRIRTLYMNGRGERVTQLVARLRNPDLPYLTRASGSAGVTTDADLIAGVEDESAEAAALRAEAEAVRRDLVARAQPVLAAQDRARALLARAELAAARDAAARAELAARRAALDALSRNVSFAVAPAVTKRGRRAAAAEAPVVDLIEQSCCDVPAGYRATGQTITGIASWYGPGFVGSPTATGAPYDPERLTAAMLAVPLGTVVRVTTDDGLAVVVLVNDRGPYVDGRVIDLSRAGARRLGFSGLRRVTVEVLERV